MGTNEELLAVRHSNDWAIVCGNYLNAYSIVQSLRALSWPGHIISIKTDGESTTLVELADFKIESWSLTLDDPNDLISIIANRIPLNDKKYVFFTDERFHEAFCFAKSKDSLPNSVFSIGSDNHLDIILDRYAFVDFIDSRRLANVPKTIPGNLDPWQFFSGKFFIRVKRTWGGLKKLSRVNLVSSREQQQAVESIFRQSGLDRNDWCYQEVLSVSSQHNVSICGWHDVHNKSYFATRKVLQHPPKTGNGDVCEIIQAPEGLKQSTEQILDALEYTGPFEMEFVLDKNSGEYKVIELNPRFWMQHGLIEAATGHELIQRYIGSFMKPVSPKVSLEPRYWMNTIYTIWRLLKFDMRVLPYLRSPGKVLTPSVSQALRWIPYYIVQKLENTLLN